MALKIANWGERTRRSRIISPYLWLEGAHLVAIWINMCLL